MLDTPLRPTLPSAGLCIALTVLLGLGAFIGCAPEAATPREIDTARGTVPGAGPQEADTTPPAPSPGDYRSEHLHAQQPGYQPTAGGLEYGSDTSDPIYDAHDPASARPRVSRVTVAAPDNPPQSNRLTYPPLPVDPTPAAATATTASYAPDPVGAAPPAEPRNADSADDSTYSLDRAIATIEQLIASNPDDATAQLALRMLYAAYGQRERALGELPNVDEQAQANARQLADAMLLAAQLARAEGAEDPELANRALEALEELTERIARQADLAIARLALCRRVEGFGRYELIPEADLASGRPQRILVYCELRNFQSQRNADNMYLTRLHARITVYNSNFDVIAQRADDVTDAPSHNPRRDFFLRGALDLPSLSPGRYQVVVRIEDRVADKIADARYEFEVTGNPQ